MTVARNPDADAWDHQTKSWNQLREEILSRDAYTCQRCETRPDTRPAVDRDLHVHTLSADAVSDDTHVTLCTACHAVQHPETDAFDGIRADAPVYPSYDAHLDVAVVNRLNPAHDPVDETIWLQHCTFDRDEYICQRCCTRGVSPHGRMDGVQLTVTPIDHPVDYGFACIRDQLTVCRPCYRLLHREFDDAEVEARDDLGPRFPAGDAHPAVAHPLSPRTPAEEEEVREFLFKLLLNRDNQTCNRCRMRLKADPDEYPHNFVSLYTPHDEETYDPEDYLLLCSPCYAVLDPHNPEFHQFFPYAQEDPHPEAHPWVAAEKTHYRPEDLQTVTDATLHDIFAADDHRCQRCAARESDPAELVAYPTFDLDADVVEGPLTSYTTLCQPCGSVVFDADDRTEFDDVHALDSVGLDRDAFERAAAGAPRTPTYPVGDDLVDVDRDPVNRTERLLVNSWLRYPHVAWQLGGTTGLAISLFFAALPAVQEATADGITNPATGGPISLWIESLGGLAILALVVGTGVRWGVADLSSRVWRALDTTIESHHYRINAAFELRRLLRGYIYLFGLPYLTLIALHLLFTLCVTITVLL